MVGPVVSILISPFLESKYAVPLGVKVKPNSFFETVLSMKMYRVPRFATRRSPFLKRSEPVILMVVELMILSRNISSERFFSRVQLVCIELDSQSLAWQSQSVWGEAAEVKQAMMAAQAANRMPELLTSFITPHSLQG
jgi:hypothetical protein